MIEKIHKDIQTNLRKFNQELVNMKLVSESMTRIGKEGLRFFKFKANVMPAKPAPTITIGFCIDFIREVLLCVNVLLNYTNNF